MTTEKSKKPELLPPFDPDNDDSRRQYILRRVRGVPVPPYPDFSHGETPYDLIAAWIRSRSIPWANKLRQDVRFLLKSSLKTIATDSNNTKAWELGGLLALAARLKDKECGKTTAGFMSGKGDIRLSSSFLSIYDRDGLYGTLGQLMFNVIDITSPQNTETILQAGIEMALTAAEGISLLPGVARRNPEQAKEIAPGLIKNAFKDSDQHALSYAIRLLREACWAKDDLKTSMEIRDMFIRESRDFREFVAETLTSIMPTWNVRISATELREGAVSSPEFRTRAKPGVFSWSPTAQ